MPALAERDATRIDIDFLDGHNLLVSLVLDIYAKSFELIDQYPNFILMGIGPFVADISEAIAS